MQSLNKTTSERITSLRNKLQQKRREIGLEQPINIMAFDKFEKGFFNKIVWRDK